MGTLVTRQPARELSTTLLLFLARATLADVDASLSHCLHQGLLSHKDDAQYLSGRKFLTGDIQEKCSIPVPAPACSLFKNTGRVFVRYIYIYISIYR